STIRIFAIGRSLSAALRVPAVRSASRFASTTRALRNGPLPCLPCQQHRSFRPIRQGTLLGMAEHQLTPFEHVLIGLVCLSPASGYDLKRIFAATPMGLYQPSSGSLYPALRRLEGKGLVKALDGTGESARHRRVYEPTQAGRAAHATWLRTPVEV